jgi:hypothetical protein
VSSCSDSDLITCNQSAYDDASSYCDSISQGGDSGCIQQNMTGASACPCAQEIDGTSPSSNPGATFTVAPVTITGSTKAKTTTAKPVTTKSVVPTPTPAEASALSPKNLAIGAAVVVGYLIFKAKMR